LAEGRELSRVVRCFGRARQATSPQLKNLQLLLSFGIRLFI